jgi:hypothetical protein
MLSFPSVKYAFSTFYFIEGDRANDARTWKGAATDTNG